MWRALGPERTGASEECVRRDLLGTRSSVAYWGQRLWHACSPPAHKLRPSRVNRNGRRRGAHRPQTAWSRNGSRRQRRASPPRAASTGDLWEVLGSLSFRFSRSCPAQCLPPVENRRKAIESKNLLLGRAARHTEP